MSALTKHYISLVENQTGCPSPSPGKGLYHNATRSKEELEELLGPLQFPSKMPCPSWSISSQRCVSGQILRKQPGTICQKCYARRGHFVFGPVHEANEFRLAAYYAQEDWVDLMAQYISLHVSFGDPHFRWFSSGDLQSVQMLTDIIKVCELTPGVFHWLPTQERKMVRSCTRPVPPNLVIRVSSPMINGAVVKGFSCTSVTAGPIPENHWEERVVHNTATRFHCPAGTAVPYKCGACRACWSKKVETVVYKLR